MRVILDIYSCLSSRRQKKGSDPGGPVSSRLNLRVGEWVEVRNKEEILATLDESGRLENLPFMPEMLQYCGRPFRVYKRADKTCDYIRGWSIRRIDDCVHLEGVRCDGQGHEGCQASCLIFWKEAWLKRAAPDVVPTGVVSGTGRPVSSVSSLCTVQMLHAATRHATPDGGTQFSCQATDVPLFTSWMSFWDPRQYIRELRSGNLDSGFAGNSRQQQILEFVLTILHLIRASVIGYFNEYQDRRGGRRYPFIQGAAEKTPIEILNLQPGELVEVRSKEEILATLGKDQKNRGLWFDAEMLPYCGGIYRVLRRVHRVLDEKTGRLLELKQPCIILEGVVCKSEFHRLCPRAIYPFWREAWLKRTTVVSAANSATAQQSCEVQSCGEERSLGI